MAHSIRRPLSSALGLPSTLQHRAFSSTPQCAKLAQLKSQHPRAPADPSLRLLQKQAQRQGIVGDYGLLPQTFVLPVWKNLPKAYVYPRSSPLLYMYFLRVKGMVSHWASSQLLFWTSPRLEGSSNIFKRTFKIDRKSLVPTAKAKYNQMYSALAEGDNIELSRICGDGLLQTMLARVAGRPKGERWKWELVEYISEPKLVANSIARMPTEGAALHQAIVRIHSKQKLTRFAKGSKVPIEGTGQTKDVMEYVVLQNIYTNNIMGKWLIWGTTRETTYKEALEWEKV